MQSCIIYKYVIIIQNVLENMQTVPLYRISSESLLIAAKKYKYLRNVMQYKAH